MICIECKKDTNAGYYSISRYGTPNAGPYCNVCLPEHESKKLIVCQYCGSKDRVTYWDEINTFMEEHDVCYKCGYYLYLHERYGSSCIRAGHFHYLISNANEPRQFRGFGGRRFKITSLDSGTTVITDNLWCQGDIPEALWNYLSDNATVEEV